MRRLTVLALLLTTALAAPADDETPILVIDSGGHTGKINDVIFTPDGRRLISASNDKTVRLWDAATGAPLRTFRGQIGAGDPGKIYAAALSPDGRLLAVGGWLAGEPRQRDAVRLHDVRTGDVLALLEGHTSVVLRLAFSPDGRLLASASGDETVRVWGVPVGAEPWKSAKHVLPGHTDQVCAVAFSPDSARLASGSYDHTLRLWDASKGTRLSILEGHSDKVDTAAFSPDGRYLASGSWDKTVRLWEAVSGRFVKVLGEQSTTVNSLSFSPDSRLLLTGTGAAGAYQNMVFAVPSGEVVMRFAEHKNIVLATAIAPDGATAATGGGINMEILLWDLRSGAVRHRLEGRGRRVLNVAFADDGQSLAFGNTFRKKSDHDRGPLERILHLPTDGGQRITLGEAPGESAAFRRALPSVADSELRTRKGEWGRNAVLQIVRGGEVIHEIERDGSSGYRHKCYTFTPDGRVLASGGADGVLTLYDPRTGKKLRDLVGHTGDVMAVAPSSDGRTLVSGSTDQTVRLWDVASGKNLLTIFVADDAEWVAWTPEGYYDASLRGERYIGWHVNRGVDQQADWYPAERFRATYYRPNVIAAHLELRDIDQALSVANARRGDRRPAIALRDPGGILPPEIFLAAPAENSMIDGVLRIDALATSQNLPIRTLEVLLDGVALLPATAGVAAKDGRERSLNVEIELDATGAHTLTLIASHESASSNPLTRRIYVREAAEPPVAQKPDLLIVAIGIADYDHQSFRLSFPDDDARAVVASLRAQEGVLYEHVRARVLPEEGAKADRTAIVQALSWLAEEGTSRDVRLLYLSGHGDRDPRGNYYFFGQTHQPGANFEIHNVSWRVLLDMLKSTPGKAVLMVDTCHAAAVTGGGAKSGQGGADLTQVLLELNSGYTGLVTYAASASGEKARERKEWGHGAFTKVLLEALAGRADGYGGGEKDGAVETSEIGRYLEDHVEKLTGKRQHALYLASESLPSFPLLALR